MEQINAYDEENKKGPSMEELQEDLEAVKKISKTGYILIGFPNTLEGAITLEKEVAGYVPEEERP